MARFRIYRHRVLVAMCLQNQIEKRFHLRRVLATSIALLVTAVEGLEEEAVAPMSC